MFFDYMLLEENPFKVAPTKKIKKEKAKIIDAYTLQLSDIVCEEMNEAELAANRNSALLYDIESYSNYALILFRHPPTGKIISFEDDDTGKRFNIPKLKWILENYVSIGFNSRDYDMPITCLALANKRHSFLHSVTKDIIFNGSRAFDIYKRYKLNYPNFDHIDLISVCPLQGSLKLYSGRLHSKRMQSLPIDPDKKLDAREKQLIKSYCNNDLYNTETVFDEVKPHLELRIKMSKQYGVDLRSKSDAQIAETVIVSELTKLTGSKPVRPELHKDYTFWYKVPSYIQYTSSVLNNMLNSVSQAAFTLNDAGYVIMPTEIEGLEIPLGNCVYRMGIGGLHSSEKTVTYKADDQTLLIDRDVASYYPSIILNDSLYPRHLGIAFLDVYRTIVNRRLEAKKTGDKLTADSLKITINGSFGKLGNKWSALYSPDLLMQVTLTGQLALLMLIEMIENVGIPVVSGNTDGIIIKCPVDRQTELKGVIDLWEFLTGFATEETRYKAIYSRDVNNYIAIQTDGKVKVKGTYSDKGSALNSPLSKNPENNICNMAVIKLLSDNVPLVDTITSCNDIRQFLTIRNVKGGAVKSGTQLGKCVRWYFSTKIKGEISYNGSGNKVPNTEGAMPLMELPETFPDDIDYTRYINIANDILVDVGYSMPTKANKIVETVFNFS